VGKFNEHVFILEDLIELVKTVDTWREAVCTTQAPLRHGHRVEGEYCDGANHLIDCPVEKALQDVLAIHNKIVPS
jgi:hypothetical protein